ncbi:MAG: cupin domain-containing protein [Acidimicrobiia bacterium]|nr:cupin domain-containing protein [Acidimicrobiia bacterium]
MSDDQDFDDVELIGLEQRGDTQVLRNVVGQPGLETIEGRLVPLLSGEAIKAHIIVMHPGQYASAHAHETESIIYTISGSWVSCTTEGDNEIRTVVNAGDLFRFGGGVPTGYETPFDEPAVILILKGGAYSYDDMKAGMLEARAILDEQAAGGEPFSYAELEPDHPAVAFARDVTGRDPVEHFSGK